MAFDQTSAGRRVLVATESNVLASLHARTGEIAWRQVFRSGAGGKIDAMLHNESYLITVSGNGKILRSWDAGTGSLVWEEVAAVTESTSKPSHAQAVFAGQDMMAVLTSSNVYVHSLKDGTSLWSKELPNSESVNYQWIHCGGDVIYVIGLVENSHISIVSYQLNNDGEPNPQRSLPAAWASVTGVSCIVVGNSNLVCVESLTNSLHSVVLKEGASFISSPVIALGLPEAETETPKLTALNPVRAEFTLHLTPTHTALMRQEGNSIKVVLDLPKVILTGAATFGSQEVILTLEPKTQLVYVISCFDAKTGVKIKDTKQLVALPLHNGSPTQMKEFLFSKKESQFGYRILLQTQDYSLSLIQQPGKIVWSREEALSRILSVEMVDLPVTDTEAKFEDEFGHQGDDVISMFLRRLTTQFAQIQTYIMSLKRRMRHGHHHEHLTAEDSKPDRTNNANDDDDDDDDEYLRRDQFNLHKMIIAVCESGKLYGLDSEDGSIIWRQFIPNLQYFERSKTLPLFIQRTTAHFPHPPQAAIVGRDKISGQTLMYSFNPITGKPSDVKNPLGKVLNYQLQQVTLLPLMDQEFLKIMILMDTEYKIHVIPAEAKSLLQEKLSSLFLFTANASDGSLAGYALVDVGNEHLHSEMVWNVQLPDDQRIISIAAKRPTEHVHSQGRVLGDRSVLYRYLNPNLVAIAAEGIDTAGKQFLNMYLVDTVTGSLVFTANHKKSTGPVHMVQSENWIVYEYWNSRHRRHEVTVLELYEGTKDRNSTVFSSLDPPEPPIVMRQSYILPYALQDIGVTSTEKGITNKALIFCLQSGGVVHFPKAYLDPRRPLVPTTLHKEEGIIPYLPELPISTEAYINYNKTVLGVRGVQTAPAGLESTSLVLVYGLDLFYTRVFPSKMFDVLKDDFDYYLIITVVIGLLAASVITQKLASMKTLKKAWR
ncbi:ER membrane protein complex subunit 1-like [Saccoglossus kowalevskii]